MRKVLHLTLTISIFCAFALTGCSKDNEVEPSKQALIAGKKWAPFSGTYRIGKGPEQDALEGSTDCLFDDYNMYYKNGQYEYNNGATKCTEESAQVSARGTWFINGDTLNVYISLGPGAVWPSRRRIVKLTEHELITEDLLSAHEDPDSAWVSTFTYRVLD
ncbi:hypothetical protein C8N40_101679 [Pontibacter mucosus]|uniref:Lipocalin-like protein n=1 Tax=Pontibacter mucosus TaxID=1649266 RepID=A0A2T5YU93_9BACT|nr:hypothetical protein [Pontibacter mucosus]PTX22851.1 hypothetical protein C8N40_101679 [Pontibacter mucosus]